MKTEDVLMDDYEEDVELASAWERIGAYLLNSVFQSIASIPMITAIVMGMMKGYDEGLTEMALISAVFNSWFMLGVLVYFVFIGWQIYLMSKYGQSLGKKLLNLRVIRINGDNAGFVHVVLLREVVFYIGLFIVALVFGLLGDISALMGNLVQFAAQLTCLVMLFVHHERRTLQDLIADTVVIKVPR